MSPPQSPFVRLDSNAWLEIFLFLPSLRDVVKTWVAFCLSKHGISVQHPIWLQLLSLRLSLDTNAFLLRTNYPTSATDKQGLVFFARLHKKKKCSRSGCFMEFIECENTANSCRFHPGKTTAVGVLSCCRAKNFKEMGCAARFHTGDFFEFVNQERPDEEKTTVITPNISNTNSIKLPAVSITPTSTLTQMKQPNKLSSTVPTLPPIL